MDRDEALDVLEEVRSCTMSVVLSCELDAAIAALSSPCAICGGKEPLAVVKAHVSEYLGPNYHLSCYFEGPAGLGKGHTWPKWFPVRVIILEDKP